MHGDVESDISSLPFHYLNLSSLVLYLEIGVKSPALNH
ncbi:MAG: hypothetical protein XU11_C0010G0026 [Candidatus Dadabacteria bacterium CSP1-2]|jgi:hypothetical protein|nr:MAG: hypothetical protein XU11_C0010G0026 [Candidatus Dadabacteria bacterium CSP1-2]